MKKTWILLIENRMDWITENIAIGNFIDAQTASTDEFDAILCLKERCCDENDHRFYTLCIPLVDGAGNDPKDFDDAVEFIDDIVQAKEKILVHCHAGRSRSVCIVARYLMTKHKLTLERALALIKNEREVYLSPGIEEILMLKR